jgi:hypothetical protein
MNVWYDLEDDVDDAYRREALRRIEEARSSAAAAEPARERQDPQ